MLGLLVGVSSLAGQMDEPPWEFSGDLEERAEEVATQLALRETETLRIDPALKASIRADLERIYAYDAGLAAAPAMEWVVPGTVLIRLDEEADAQLSEGTYSPWETLQEELGPGEATRYTYSPLWVLRFAEPYQPAVLAERIEAEWPGVESAHPDGLIGDGSDVLFSPAFRWYAFILRWGDCPAGCTGEKRRVVAIEDGEVIELDQGDAHERLEVLAVDYETVIHAAVGDRLFMRPSATVGRQDEPGAVSSDLQYGAIFMHPEIDPVFARFPVRLHEPTFSYSAHLGVREPLSQATWYFPFVIEQIERPEALNGDRYADYWLEIPLGWLSDRHYPWLWTDAHGWWWFSEEGSTAKGWWIWDFELGWSYVGWDREGTTYPFVYADGRWLYYESGSVAPRWFFDYRADDWLEAD